MDIPQVSFSHGEIDPIAAARTDEDFYASSVKTAVNFFVRRQGGASNRPGLQYIGNCLSNTPLGSYLLPFIYNNEQSYLTEFSADGIQFYSNGAFVQNVSSSATITGITLTTGPFFETLTVLCANTFLAGQTVTISGVVDSGSFSANGTWMIETASGTQFTVRHARVPSPAYTYASGGTATIPYNLGNPYVFSDLLSLRAAQSADVLNVVVNTQPMYQLKRLTASSFSFTAPAFFGGPFQDINTDGVTFVEATKISGAIQLVASSPIFNPNHVGALFQLQEQDLSLIPPWEAEKILTNGGGVAAIIGLYRRSNFKNYKCVGSLSTGTPLTIATGTFQPDHTQLTQADGDGNAIPNFANSVGVSWLYQDSGFGVVLITGYIDSQHVSAVVQPNYIGGPALLPLSCVGGPQVAVGPFPFTGNGVSSSFGPLTAITTADPTRFYVTIAGVYQSPSNYIINLAGTDIAFSTPPANGAAIVVEQITTLGQTTYWAFGAFSADQGWASDVCYYNDRLVLAGTQKQPQTFFCSQVSDYINYSVSNPQIDSDAITETINARQQNPINNLLPLNNLLIGTATATWRCTDPSGIGAITPSDISLLPQEFYGTQPVAAVQTGTTIIYAQWGGRKIRDIIYQFMYDKFLGSELTVYAQENMFPYGTTATRLAFAPEPYGLLFCVRSDGVLCVCAYLPEQRLIAWTRYITAGNFEDVAVIPENGTFSVYVIVGRTVGGQYARYIERFAPREVATNDDYFFVDSGLTYDGRNTSTTTMIVTGGTTWLANDTGTLNASSSAGWAGFQSTDVGNQIWIYDAAGERSRLAITAVITSTQASVSFADPVPTDLQGVTTAVWTFAKANLSGLTNLIGQTVSVFADGGVMPQVVVGPAGALTLQNPGGVVHAGLPYTAQLESLNFNIQGQQTIRNHAKLVTRLSIVVDRTLPFDVGQGFEDNQLEPIALRQFAPMGQVIQPYTGVVHCQLQGFQDDNARVCIQEEDPVPVTVLSWIADVDVGEPG